MKDRWSLLKKIILICIVSWALLHLILRSKPLTKQIYISHRGAASLAPENTLSSVQAAVETGAEYIEIDVQRTVDQVVVLLHDRSIDRTTNGVGSISKLYWEDVKNVNIEYPIPKLQDILDYVSQTDSTLVIELKNPSDFPGIEQQIVTLIEINEMTSRVIILSFNLESIDRIARLNPEIETGHLYIQGIYLPQLRKTSLVDVFWLVPIMDPSFIWRNHRENRQVWVWTVDNTLAVKFFLWLGVDGITTNYPQHWPIED